MSEGEVIVAKMVREILHVVHWDDLTLHRPGLVDPKEHIVEKVLEAAKKLKEAGHSWEEWT